MQNLVKLTNCIAHEYDLCVCVCVCARAHEGGANIIGQQTILWMNTDVVHVDIVDKKSFDGCTSAKLPQDTWVKLLSSVLSTDCFQCCSYQVFWEKDKAVCEHVRDTA